MIVNGAFTGRSLRWLMEHHRDGLLGRARAGVDGRFPLLCKILDARDRLSLQVHPPPPRRALGDPKTEMWYIAAAEPGAELYVGLKRGVTREAFEEGIRTGRVEHCFHRIHVRAGDAMFLPSGRVHGIGGGVVIFEIQQNSDTTFRVFDWNRLGLDGKPRDLHVAESLACIDFSDIEPPLAAVEQETVGGFHVRALVRDELFEVDVLEALTAASWTPAAAGLRVLAVLDRDATVTGGGCIEVVHAGEFAVLPARLTDVSIAADPGSRLLVVAAGS